MKDNDNDYSFEEEPVTKRCVNSHFIKKTQFGCFVSSYQLVQGYLG